MLVHAALSAVVRCPISSPSTLPTAPSRPLAQPAARSWLLLAAPLVALAGWPLWLVLGTTLTLLLARRWDALRRVRLLAFLGLVVAGGLPSWLAAPHLLATWSATQATVPLLLGVILLHVALWALEGGTRILGTVLLGLFLLGSALLGTGEPWALVWGVVGLLLAVSGTPGQEGRALRSLSGGLTRVGQRGAEPAGPGSRRGLAPLHLSAGGRWVWVRDRRRGSEGPRGATWGAAGDASGR